MDQPDWPEVARQMQGTINGLRAEIAEWREQFRVLAILEQQKTAELVSRKIDVETFREGNRQLRGELAAKDARIAEFVSAALARQEDYEAKDVRIAQLEEALHITLDEREEEMARAERAEACIAELEQANSEIAIEALRDHRELFARDERAEAEADSLRNTIDNMRAMNIKLTLEAAGQVAAAEAEVERLNNDITAKAHNMRYMDDRFRRAEAERDVLDHAFKALGNDMANLGRERDAMLEALALWYDKDCDCEMCCQARAALAPSPAGREPS